MKNSRSFETKQSQALFKSLLLVQSFLVLNSNSIIRCLSLAKRRKESSKDRLSERLR